MWRPTRSTVAKWHAALVRRGSFHWSNPPPPTSPILQIVARLSSLMGTQRLMHCYTSINTLLHRPSSHTVFGNVIIFLFHLLSLALSVLLMSIVFRRKEKRKQLKWKWSPAVSNDMSVVFCPMCLIMKREKCKWTLCLFIFCLALTVTIPPQFL